MDIRVTDTEAVIDGKHYVREENPVVLILDGESNLWRLEDGRYFLLRRDEGFGRTPEAIRERYGIKKEASL